MGDTLALHQSLGKVPVVRLRLYISVIAGASSSAALGNLKHFFLDCPIYIQVRSTLIGNINKTNNHSSPQLIQHEKTTTYDIVNQGPGFGQAHKCTWVKSANGIPTLPSVCIPLHVKKPIVSYS
jgi:hypothetical protein